jgi:hypothetical protein
MLLLRHVRANLIAYVAIFASLGGTSYAAIAIPNNSVGNKQLKKDAVDTAKMKNGSVMVLDFKAGQAPAAPKGAKGDPGDPGPNGAGGGQGQKGDKGLPGDAATGGYSVTSLNHGTAAEQKIPNGPPQLVVRKQTFATTAAASTVIIKGHMSVSVSCQNGSTSCFIGDIGAFVDGAGIPGTKNPLSGQGIPPGVSVSNIDIAAEGVLPGVGPGSHEIQYGLSGSGPVSISVNGISGEALVVQG